MWKTLSHTFRDSWQAKVVGVFLAGMTIWWLSIYYRGLTEGFENDLFTVSYGLAALWGGIWGLVSAKYWGGLKSVLGKSLTLFSLGLLGQEFGQIVYSIYIYVLDKEPFPGIGDIGFFSTWVFYAFGLMLLAKVAGARFSFKSFKTLAQAIVVPLIFLVLAYSLFLQGYEFDWTSPIKVILDFGYPLGAGIYLSFAILAYLLTRKALGGIMKASVIFLIVALIFEALGDYTYNYQLSRETWYVGGSNDFLFLWAYSLMALGLMQIGVIFNHIRERT
jgi:hypothetical protein